MGFLNSFIKRVRADSLTNQGVGHRDKGRAAYEKSCYEKALKLYPTHCGANYNFGGYYYNRGEFDEAIKHYTNAIETEQWLGTGKFIKFCHYMRALSYQAIGNLESAKVDIKKAIDLNPGDAMNHRAQG